MHVSFSRLVFFDSENRGRRRGFSNQTIMKKHRAGPATLRSPPVPTDRVRSRSPGPIDRHHADGLGRAVFLWGHMGKRPSERVRWSWGDLGTYVKPHPFARFRPV